MKRFSNFLSVLIGCLFCHFTIMAQKQDTDIKNIKVYHEKGMFGGWPANFGIWNWGNEILVGFSKGFYKDLGKERHNIDREKAEHNVLARSLDGGDSWVVEDPGKTDNGALFVPNHGSYHGIERKDIALREVKECSGIDFKNPDLAFTVRMTNTHGGESLFWYSYDRGHAWEGPFKLPMFNTKGIAARTDYIIDGKDECMLFLTAAKSNGKEGRVMCVKTLDGGKSWNFVFWIGAEPDGYAIMPASVRISEKEILVSIRENKHISAYKSHDNGITWKKLVNPVEDTGEGNPPAMIKMRDGRICLVWGSRKAPFSILGKLSSNNGNTWSKTYTLREDGAGRDIGYPRMIQRPDGKLVAVYYFMDKETGPERYIGASVWAPPSSDF